MCLLCQHFSLCFCLSYYSSNFANKLDASLPAAKAYKAYKFARPFYWPYHKIWVRQDTGMVVHPGDRPQADPIRVAYNRIWHCTDSISDVFWPTRAIVTQTRSRGITGNIAEEAKTQTTDAVSGSESIPSRSTVVEKWSQGVDPIEVDEDMGSVTKRAPESAIWRSCYSQGTRMWSPDLRAGNCNNSYKLLIAFLNAVITS